MDRRKKIGVILILAVLAAGCRSSSSLVAPSDETAEAGEVVKGANDDLKQIKVLFNENEGKRAELIAAMEAHDGAKVRKTADEVVQAINNGFAAGKSAMDKIDQARGMNINQDYAEYLGLKSDALGKQMEAFEEYRQAARKLRDSYHPDDKAARESVKADFEERNRKFQELMGQAREYSTKAKDLAKSVRDEELGVQ